MRYLCLILLAVLTFSGCKQETNLIEPNNNFPRQLPPGFEFSGSYHPNVISPTELAFDFFESCEGNECDSMDGPEEDFSFFAIIFDKITYTINTGINEYKNEVDVIFNPLDEYAQMDLAAENVPTNYKNPSFVDLTKTPEPFRTPVLADFCSETDEDTKFVAHKYSADNLNGNLYAFSILGKCDDATVRCSLIYLTQDRPEMDMFQMRRFPVFFDLHKEYIFDKHFEITQLMGIDGQHMNCEKMDPVAFPRPGCMDEGADNFEPYANISMPQYCFYPVLGCTDPSAINYNPQADTDDNSCIAAILGCTDPGANNYNASANQNDQSCTYTISGCTDPIANNYDPTATVDDFSCTYDIFGCTDEGAINFNPIATIDDDSCDYFEEPE